MNIIRNLLFRWARAHVPATYVGQNAWVAYGDCPQPAASPGLDPSRDRAYCRIAHRVCPNLQGMEPEAGNILCKIAGLRKIVSDPTLNTVGFAPSGKGSGQKPMWNADGVLYVEQNGDGGFIFVLGDVDKAMKLCEQEYGPGDYDDPDAWHDCRLFSSTGEPEPFTQLGGDGDYVVLQGGHVMHLEYVKKGEKPKVVKRAPRKVGFWYIK